MAADPIYDMDDPKTEKKIRRVANMRDVSLRSLAKEKLLDVTMTECVAHLVGLGVVVSYLALLFTGASVSSVFDTIFKMMMGVYVGILGNTLVKK